MATVTEVKSNEILVAWDDGSPALIIPFGNFSTEITAAATTQAPGGTTAKLQKLDSWSQQYVDNCEAAMTEAESAIAQKGAVAEVLHAIFNAGMALRGGSYDKPKLPPEYDAALLKRYWAFATQELDYQMRKGIEAAKGAQTGTSELNARGTIEQGPRDAEKVLIAYRAYEGRSDAEVRRMEEALADGRKVIEGEYLRMKQEGREDRLMPADTYKGADKARIKDLVQQSWKKEFPGTQVLAVRIPDDWVRNQGQVEKDGRTWQVDQSLLFVFVVVKTDSVTATIYPCAVGRDNIQKGDLTVSTTMGGPGSYVPNQMLVKNVK